MAAWWHHLDKLESYICRILLAVFVTLLFVQVVARNGFGTSISWIEELSVIMFVWFAYFGASYAARMAAHNRVTFHIRMLPRPVGRVIEAIGDAFWLLFNVVFIYYAFRYIGALKPFVKAQTLGWEMKWVMAPLPLAFILITLRVLQVNYMKLVQGIDPRDPDEVEIDSELVLAAQELPPAGGKA